MARLDEDLKASDHVHPVAARTTRGSLRSGVMRTAGDATLSRPGTRSIRWSEAPIRPVTRPSGLLVFGKPIDPGAIRSPRPHLGRLGILVFGKPIDPGLQASPRPHLGRLGRLVFGKPIDRGPIRSPRPLVDPLCEQSFGKANGPGIEGGIDIVSGGRP
jgi:hypothetical protein